MRSFDLDLRRFAGGIFSIAILIGSGSSSAQDSATPDSAAPAQSPAADSAASAPAGGTAPAADAAPADGSTAAAAPADGTAPAEAATPPDAAPAAPAPDQTAEVIPVKPVQEEPRQNLKVSEGASKLDTIEVTGSRIRRTDYETAVPLLVVKREDIERTGLSSIGDILQNLPQAGSAINTQLNNGGDGSTEIDLRNLGSNRVLVLVNGRRWVGGVSSLRTSSVDLNTIPIAVIDSIEILKDGASAIYGSDAIAGVINIKTRKDFNGAELRGQMQGFEDGRGLTQALNYSTGAISGNTSSFINISYVNQGQVLAADRPTTNVPVYGTGLSRGSGFLPEGRTLFVPAGGNGAIINGGPQTDLAQPCYDIAAGVANGTFAGLFTPTDPNPGSPVPGGLPIIPAPIGPPVDNPVPIIDAGSAVVLCDLVRKPPLGQDPNGDFPRYDANRDSYNYAPVNYLSTPNQRMAIYGQISSQLNDNIHVGGEVLYNVRKSSQRLAETPLGVGDALPAPFKLAYVDSTNPFNPTNPQSPYYIPGTAAQNIGLGDPAAGVVGLGAVLRRMVELGPRVFKQSVDTTRIGGGLDGNQDFLNRTFTWSAGGAFSENKLATTEEGLLDMIRVARALGPVDQCVNGDTTVQLPPAAAGCVPLDLFGGPGTITPKMLHYISYTAHDTADQRQTLFYADFSTELGELVGTMPAPFFQSPLGLAAGLEYRKESFVSQPDPLKIAGTSSTNSSTASIGAYSAKEAYVELQLPVLRDIPFADYLNVDLAGRFSDYGRLGRSTSGKLGIEWKILEDLKMRATASTAFRAPSITDLYLGKVTSFNRDSDPCANLQLRADNPNVAANCDADGAATSQSQSQIPSVFGGNPDLHPETAKTLSAGFVMSPRFLPEFNMTVDWYQIKLKDFISFLGDAQILALCYQPAPDKRQLCDHIQRTPSGQLAQIDNTAINYAKLTVEGVDLNADYRLPFAILEPYGTFKLTLDTSYVKTYDQTLPTPDGASATTGLVGLEFGGFGGIPRIKATAGLTWKLADYEVSWSARYIHHLVEQCDDGRQDPGPPDPNAGNPTAIKSLEQYGLCSGPKDPVLGILNDIPATVYNDIQAVWNVPGWDTKLTFGVNNVLDQDPPKVYTAFASTYDPTTYDMPGSRQLYVSFIKNF